jgi:sulfur relay protein TusB/DsrH
LGKIILITKLDKNAITLTRDIVESGDNNKIILLSDSIFVLEERKLLDMITSMTSDKTILYALKEDIEKRSIKNDVLNMIDYEELVDILMEPRNSIINL